MITVDRPSEVTEVHTRLLRMGLAAEDSRAYWEHAGRALRASDRVQTAFEERWFGSRTMARVRYLISNFAVRFEAYPDALKVLHRWNPADPRERFLLCHWHIQLSDPLYRDFTGSVLPQRRSHPEPTIDRTTTVRFVDRKTESRWAPSTSQRMAAGLMACACEAGLCEGNSSMRALKQPRVSDHALGYLLHLLRGTTIEGSLKDNPYLVSVGIDREEFERRVRRLSWMRYNRMGNVEELEFEYPNLLAWASEVLA